MTIDDRDLDRLVSEYAGRWRDARPQPPSLPETLRQIQQTRHVRHRAWAIAATVVIVTAIAATTVSIAAAHHGSTRVPSGTHPTVATSHVGALTLRHPRQWAYLPAFDPNGTGPSSPVGYLSNQLTIETCHANPNRFGCGAPGESMSAGGVYIDITQLDVPEPSPERPTQTIAGYPAYVTVGDGSQPACPAGASVSIIARITISNGHTGRVGQPWGYIITACLAGSHLANAEHQVRQMLDTATLATTPTPTPIPTQSGPTVVQITPKLFPYRGTCVSTDLRAAVTDKGSEASAPFLVIRLTNTSSSSCTMDGYVNLSAYDRTASHPLPLAIETGTYEVPDPGPTLITMKPHGGSAYFVIGTGTAYDGGANAVLLVRLEFGLGDHQGTVSLLLSAYDQLGATPNQSDRYYTGLTALSAHPPAGLESHH